MKNAFAFIKKNWLLLLIGVVFVWGLTQSSDGPIPLIKTADYNDGYAAESIEQSFVNSDFRSDRVASLSAASGESAGVFDESGLVVDQKVIRTGSLSLHVDDVQESAEDIEAKATEWGGFVQNSNVDRGGDSYYAWMSIKVPADSFDAAMEGLKELSLVVNSESSNAQDVTERYTDLEARLNNLQAEEESYLALLAQSERTDSLEEVLDVTRALSEVRYRIESTQGQINSLDSRIDFSTISINLTEDSNVSAVAEKWRPISTIKDSFSEWVLFLQDSADWLINLVIFGWPILLIFIIIWLVRRRK